MKMNDVWIKEAPERLVALEKALKDSAHDDVVAPYSHVALAFPSSDPHPASFDFPLIDSAAIKAWAVREGWEVSIASEKGRSDQDHSFPIRFRKKETQ
jgi:hypothetical protein